MSLTPEQQKWIDDAFNPQLIRDKGDGIHYSQCCPVCLGEGEVQQTGIDWDICHRCGGQGFLTFERKS